MQICNSVFDSIFDRNKRADALAESQNARQAVAAGGNAAVRHARAGPATVS